MPYGGRGPFLRYLPGSRYFTGLARSFLHEIVRQLEKSTFFELFFVFLIKTTVFRVKCYNFITHRVWEPHKSILIL